MTKVLFISPTSEDYLADGIFHGLRSLLGEYVVDFPKQEIVYKNCNPATKKQIRGQGFTLYGLLEDVAVDRFHISEKMMDGYFDLIIFSDIFRNFGPFLELLPYLNDKNTAVLDGADTPQPYPYAGKWWRYPRWWFLPRAHKRFLYFKREWTPETIHNMWFKLVPKRLCKYLPSPKNLRVTSFSIPEEKIINKQPIKTKLFPKHIVDPEVAKNIKGSSIKYAFDSEDEYYADLQAAKFGITTKRSGWDCLRHYEIAANAAVPCFRELDKKPLSCAPHGLNERNCIIYQSHDELMNKIERMSDQEYENLQFGTLEWVKENTTIKRAERLLGTFNLFSHNAYSSSTKSIR